MIKINRLPVLLALRLSVYLLSIFGFSAHAELSAQAKVGPEPLDWISMLSSLAIVLASILLLAWLVKKTKIQAPKSQNIRVISSLNLGNRQKMVIVEVQGQQYLLGLAGQGITLIDKLDGKPKSDALEKDQQDFSQQLKRIFNNNEHSP